MSEFQSQCQMSKFQKGHCQKFMKSNVKCQNVAYQGINLLTLEMWQQIKLEKNT